MNRSAPFLTRHDGHWSGKVREMYEFGKYLLIIATDRISAFDVVLPTQIKDKGRVLTMFSEFWFMRFGMPNHLITTDLETMRMIDKRLDFGDHRQYYEGRSMLVWKTRPLPFECVVRGYLAGSGWADYQRTGSVCGIQLPEGLVESERLPEPIFTPATKATTGHDENIYFERAADIIGDLAVADAVRDLSLRAYRAGAAHAARCGVIVADTKFEFGLVEDNRGWMMIDEALTPDSSRFWPLDQYQPGKPQPSLDKQYVRDYLSSIGWKGNGPAPELPPTVVEITREKYIASYERLTGRSFPWR